MDQYYHLPPEVKNRLHPAEVMRETQNLDRIRMTRAACLSLSWLMLCAASDLERRCSPKLAAHLKASAAEWQATAEGRL
jgi:hypothetical protein